jgi:hypothetical protein
MLTVLKIWYLFLVSGSGPTGLKGGQRGLDSALEHIQNYLMARKKFALRHSQTFYCASIEFMDMLLTDGRHKSAFIAKALLLKTLGKAKRRTLH